MQLIKYECIRGDLITVQFLCSTYTHTHTNINICEFGYVTNVVQARDHRIYVCVSVIVTSFIYIYKD